MARILTNGFEMNSVTYEMPVGTATISTTQKRTGSYSLRLADNQSAAYSWASKAEIYMGIAMWHTSMDDAERFLYFRDSDGTTIASIGFNASGQLVLYRSTNVLLATGTTIAAALGWQYLEVWFKPLNSGGRVTVKMDGVTEIDFTGDSTVGLENCIGITLNGIVDYSYYDDLVVNDTAGAVNNSWPGIVHLAMIVPDSAGDVTQLTPTGSVNNWDNVDEIPPSTAEYNASSTVDQYDLYGMTSPAGLPSNAVIANVVVNAIAALDSGAGSLKPGVKSGATESFPTTHTLSSATKLYQEAFAVNPDDSAAWASADITSLQVGAKVA